MSRWVALLALIPAAAGADGEADRRRAHAAAVTIVRDDWGIAHVTGRTDADAVFGMMYAQAEDDFPRIERNYLTALGRLAEADGEEAVWSDLRQRMFVDHDALKRDHARAPGWLKALMQAWADGLNQYLATHRDVRPKVLTRFEPWMALAFSEGSIGGDVERVPLAPLAAFYGGKAVAAAEDPRAFREPKGSNGIALGPSRTADGHPLLLINPHTSFFFRSEAQVTSGEGLNAYGAATWGQFFVYQGFNATAGWMHTTSGVDTVDDFAETIEGDRYRYGGERRPLTVRSIAIRVRQADGTLAERRFRTFATHHGPVTRAENGRWIATALMNRPLAALEQSFLRTKARDLAAFERVSERRANSTNNTLFADSAGTTAFLPPQFVPRRDDRFDYGKPVDGSDPATDWRGDHSMAELPRVVSPAGGWLANTNNWPWSVAGTGSPAAARFPRYLDQAGENPRGLHAIELLEPARRVDLDGLVRIAFDSRLPAFDLLLPPLFRAFDALSAGDPRRARLAGPVASLRGWDRRWGAKSEATTLAVFFGTELWTATANDSAGPGLARYRAMADASAERQLAALEAAVARLTADWGRWTVAWGEVNRFQRNDGAIVQRFDDARPSIPVPFTSAQWGSLASFGARPYPGTRRWYGTSGNSFVAAVSFGPRVRAVAVTAGGESGDPKSPHFDDQATRYATGRLRPVYFHADELKGHVARRYRPGE